MKDEKDIVILLYFSSLIRRARSASSVTFRLHPLFVVLAEGLDLDINARREV